MIGTISLFISVVSKELLLFALDVAQYARVQRMIHTYQSEQYCHTLRQGLKAQDHARRTEEYPYKVNKIEPIIELLTL